MNEKHFVVVVNFHNKSVIQFSEERIAEELIKV
jgi:hypothetical protein